MDFLENDIAFMDTTDPPKSALTQAIDIYNVTLQKAEGRQLKLQHKYNNNAKANNQGNPGCQQSPCNRNRKNLRMLPRRCSRQT